MRGMPFAAVVGGLLAGSLWIGCGLVGSGTAPGDGGDLPDVAPSVDGGGADQGIVDAMPDLMVEDRGQMTTDSGMTCDCVAPYPGWTLVTYDATMRPACPADYGSAADTSEILAGGGPATCACTCGAPTSQGTCNGGDRVFDLKLKSQMACTNVPDLNSTVTANPACKDVDVSLSATGNGLDWLAASPQAALAPTGATCGNPTAVPSKPTITPGAGRTCTYQPTPPMCMGGDSCIPRPETGWKMCIVTTNLSATCPGSFPQRHVIGDAITDTRSCSGGPCACSVSGGVCSTPQLEVYDMNGCNIGNRTGNVAANGTCNNVAWGNTEAIRSAKYTSTPSGAVCLAPVMAPIGQAGVTNARVACCR